MTLELAKRLQARVAGQVLSGESERATYGTDFGGVIRRAPSLILSASSEDDLREAFSFAREVGLPVAVRGAGHSCRGQTLVDGGLVVRPPSSSAQLVGNDRIEVAAGTSWYDLERELNRQGRSIPVLTDYIGLSVGGTLSVGGYGIRSLNHGTQGDNVERLRLVLPDGTALWASPTEEPELFDAALAGIGQIGVIAKAELRTIPYRPVVKLHRYVHASVEALAESALWMTERGPRPDVFYGYGSGPKTPVPDLFVSKVGFEGTSPGIDVELPSALAGREVSEIEEVNDLPFSLHDNRKMWVDWLSGHARLWTDYLFDAEGFVRFSRELDVRWREESFRANLGTLYVLAVDKKTRNRPLLDASSPTAGKLGFLVGLFYMVPEGDAAALANARRSLRWALERCAHHGGRPYLYGWNDLDDPLLARLYGDSLETIARLRARVDPAGTLRPYAWNAP